MKSQGQGPCEHPSAYLSWTEERPLYCGICDEDLQTEQPLTIVLCDAEPTKGVEK